MKLISKEATTTANATARDTPATPNRSYTTQRNTERRCEEQPERDPDQAVADAISEQQDPRDPNSTKVTSPEPPQPPSRTELRTREREANLGEAPSEVEAMEAKGVHRRRPGKMHSVAPVNRRAARPRGGRTHPLTGRTVRESNAERGPTTSPPGRREPSTLDPSPAAPPLRPSELVWN
jgi:hypothetical protein